MTAPVAGSAAPVAGDVTPVTPPSRDSVFSVISGMEALAAGNGPAFEKLIREHEGRANEAEKELGEQKRLAEQQMTDVTKRLEDVMTALAQRNAEAEKQSHSQQTRISELLAEKAHLEQRIRATDTRVEELAKSHTAADARVQTLTLERQALERSRQAIDTQLNEARTAFTQLQASSQHEIHALRAQVNTLTSDRARLEKQLNESETQNQNNIAGFKTTLARLEIALNVSSAASLALRQAAERTEERHNNETTALNKRISVLEDIVHTLRDERASIEKICSETLAQNQNLKTERDGAIKEGDRLRDRVTQQDAAAASLRKKLQAEQTKVDGAKYYAEEVARNNNELKAERSATAAKHSNELRAAQANMDAAVARHSKELLDAREKYAGSQELLAGANKELAQAQYNQSVLKETESGLKGTLAGLRGHSLVQDFESFLKLSGIANQALITQNESAKEAESRMHLWNVSYQAWKRFVNPITYNLPKKCVQRLFTRQSAPTRAELDILNSNVKSLREYDTDAKEALEAAEGSRKSRETSLKAQVEALRNIETCVQELLNKAKTSLQESSTKAREYQNWQREVNGHNSLLTDVENRNKAWEETHAAARAASGSSSAPVASTLTASTASINGAPGRISLPVAVSRPDLSTTRSRSAASTYGTDAEHSVSISVPGLGGTSGGVSGGLVEVSLG